MPRFVERLKVTNDAKPGESPDLHLYGEVDFPGHPNVTICVRPGSGQAVDDPEMLQAAEEKCVALVQNLRRILKSGEEQIRDLFSSYYPETHDIPMRELLRDMRVIHINIFFGVGDELWLSGSNYSPLLDLRLPLRPDLSVEDAWFDG
jgi:hypothetical protein